MSAPQVAASPPGGTREMLRITLSLAVACVLGAALLGAVYVATDRYQRGARAAEEARSISELLQLPPSATVRKVAISYSPSLRRVLYEFPASHPGVGGPAGRARTVVFGLDGRMLQNSPGSADSLAGSQRLLPLGRIFVASAAGRPAGSVVEGTTQGYKNRIRFLVGLDSRFQVTGVRVVEHEEDPGLGAEVATSAFCGQFAGRTAGGMDSLGVTRDPMPEDWSAALASLSRLGPEAWERAYGSLRERERTRPIYAVTGATISSRALTRGVQAEVAHFRRRWDLISPYLEAVP